MLLVDLERAKSDEDKKKAEVGREEVG
jgi:hypothetical protein